VVAQTSGDRAVNAHANAPTNGQAGETPDDGARVDVGLASEGLDVSIGQGARRVMHDAHCSARGDA